MSSDEMEIVTPETWLGRLRMRKFSEWDDVPKFMRYFARVRVQMSRSNYFLQSMEKVNHSLAAQPHIKRLERVVCLGLGHFLRRSASYYQLAFILCAQEYYGIPVAEYYDPAFTPREKEVLLALGVQLTAENRNGMYVADKPTLYYLPHCAFPLTNNLIWCNWSRQLLRNVLLINNSFALLKECHLDFFPSNAPYIVQSAKFVKEQAMDDAFEIKKIFDFLSVHIFPERKMQSVPSTYCILQSNPNCAIMGPFSVPLVEERPH